MNKHIEVVKRWLADADSVTLQELRENRLAASAVAATNAATARDVAQWVKKFLAFKNAAANAANVAAIAATEAEVSATVFLEANRDVARWVKKYEELSK